MTTPTDRLSLIEAVSLADKCPRCTGSRTVPISSFPIHLGNGKMGWGYSGRKTCPACNGSGLPNQKPEPVRAVPDEQLPATLEPGWDGV